MKKLFLVITISVFCMMLLCSCNSNNDVMASVNGVNILKSDYETRLKSNGVMRELMTEEINKSEMGSEEEEAQLKQIDEYFVTDEDAVMDSLIETAYINSKYSYISHEQAKSEMEKQLLSLDTCSDEYPQVAQNGAILDEYIKRMGLTKEEYIEIAADSYASYANKQKAKEEFAKGKELSDDEIEKQFDSYIKQEIGKTIVVHYK
ncbi:MAG: hypothetical protein ACI4JI_04135 [Ruminiclostridium sp.]